MPIRGFTDIGLKEISIQDYILPRFQIYGDKTALIDGITEEKVSYSQLLESIKTIARGLKHHGVRKGDHFLLCDHNSFNFIIMAFGSLVAGATVVTMNPKSTSYEMTTQMKDCMPRWVYASQDALPNLKIAMGSVKTVKEIFVDGQEKSCTSFSDLLHNVVTTYYSDVIVNPLEDVACILYSSGTSGLPKGVMLTHFNLVSNQLQTVHPDMKKPDPAKTEPGKIEAANTVDIAVLPMYHSYGMFRYLFFGPCNGHTIIILPRFEPVSFLTCIQKYKVTTLALVPPMVNFLAKSPLVEKYDLSSLVNIHGSGAPVPVSVAQECAKRIGLDIVSTGYGMTELSPVALRLPYWARRPGCAGIPLPNTQVLIVDPDTGKELNPHLPGEMWVKGPQLMKGYLNKPEATRQAIDEQGWLHTGDIAYYDEYNHIFIVDRVKELIKYKGFQVAPAELENLLLEHPAVLDVAVIGLSDTEAGELPKAFIVCKPGASVSKSDLQNYVKERVSAYKRLTGGVEFVHEIPKTPTGKILRRHLKDHHHGKSKL